MMTNDIIKSLFDDFGNVVKNSKGKYKKLSYTTWKSLRDILSDGDFKVHWQKHYVAFDGRNFSTVLTFDDNSFGQLLYDTREEIASKTTKELDKVLNDMANTSNSVSVSLEALADSINTYSNSTITTNSSDFNSSSNSDLWYTMSTGKANTWRTDQWREYLSSPYYVYNPKNEEKEKENKNMKFNFDFGPVKDIVHMSMYGMAIKNKNGNYVSYDPATESIIDVDILNFEGANKFMYKMPVPIADIKVGDIVVHNGIPCFVRHVPDNSVKTFEVIDPYEGEMKEILIPKSMFGFDYATKVVNLMEGMFGNTTASAENPFGNMLPLLVLNDGAKVDDMLPLMLMMNQGADMFSNPMMAYMLMKDNKNFDPMVLMLMMNQKQTGEHTCSCGGSCHKS